MSATIAIAIEPNSARCRLTSLVSLYTALGGRAWTGSFASQRRKSALNAAAPRSDARALRAPCRRLPRVAPQLRRARASDVGSSSRIARTASCRAFAAWRTAARPSAARTASRRAHIVPLRVDRLLPPEACSARKTPCRPARPSPCSVVNVASCPISAATPNRARARARPLDQHVVGFEVAHDLARCAASTASQTSVISRTRSGAPSCSRRACSASGRPRRTPSRTRATGAVDGLTPACGCARCSMLEAPRSSISRRKRAAASRSPPRRSSFMPRAAADAPVREVDAHPRAQAARARRRCGALGGEPPGGL